MTRVTPERALVGKFWMIAAKLASAVPWHFRQRNEVVELVGFPIVGKQTKWSLVVNYLAGLRTITTIATITGKGCFRLPLPVRSTIAVVAISQLGLFSPIHSSDRSPDAKAFPRSTNFASRSRWVVCETPCPRAVARNLNLCDPERRPDEFSAKPHSRGNHRRD